VAPPVFKTDNPQNGEAEEKRGVSNNSPFLFVFPAPLSRCCKSLLLHEHAQNAPSVVKPLSNGKESIFRAGCYLAATLCGR
jgi:hypothetical protein